MSPTTIRVLGNVPRFGIDDSLNKLSQVLIMRQQSMEMSKLVSSIAKPLGCDILSHQLTQLRKRRAYTSNDKRDILIRVEIADGGIKRRWECIFE